MDAKLIQYIVKRQKVNPIISDFAKKINQKEELEQLYEKKSKCIYFKIESFKNRRK